MLNFPVPYPNELLYSAIARAGIRHGIVSPKQLLDEVFDGNRKVIATLDLPNHLAAIERLLPPRFALESLVYEHTMFPLYAPFMPEERRLKCLGWMRGKSNGSIHLAMGITASALKTPSAIRYCPDCLKQQAETYGEYFWQRCWQAPGVSSCPEHGKLLSSKFVRPQLERHQFWPATPENCAQGSTKPSSRDELLIAKRVAELLSVKPGASPSCSQWTAYYRNLAEGAGVMRGKRQINYDLLAERIESRWSRQFLRTIGLSLTTGEHSWLKSLFRKHRKSFPYLQHLVVNEALLSSGWSFSDVFDHVRVMIPTPVKVRSVKSASFDAIAYTDDQKHWCRLVKKLGPCQPKKARLKESALYARLYRCCHDWLIATNKQYEQPCITQLQRVDWEARDINYSQQLKAIVAAVIKDDASPRRSQNFWLRRMPNYSTVEKYLQNLPVTRKLLDDHSETIAAYQVRRLRNTCDSLSANNPHPPRWRLLRGAGLSEQRLTPQARRILEKLEQLVNEPQSLQN